MKKIILKCGILAMAVVPVFAVVSCNDNETEDDEVKNWNLGEMKLDGFTTFVDFDKGMKQLESTSSSLVSYLKSQIKTMQSENVQDAIKNLSKVFKKFKKDIFTTKISFNGKSSLFTQTGEMYEIFTGFTFKFMFTKNPAEKKSLIEEYQNKLKRVASTYATQIFKNVAFKEWAEKNNLTLEGFIQHKFNLLATVINDLKKWKHNNIIKR